MWSHTLNVLDGACGISLSLFKTEDAPKPENKKKEVNIVPEMGFLTSGNGTSTGNGWPILVMVNCAFGYLHMGNLERLELRDSKFPKVKL